MSFDMDAATETDLTDGPLITSYDQAGRDVALLRWSLWIAAKRRCYVCGETRAFADIQIDHVILSTLTLTSSLRSGTVQPAGCGI